jgi:hypothetical protein
MRRQGYVADAVRDGGWWVVKVRDVPRARTQARRLDQVEAMARDVISLLLDVPADSFDLSVQAHLEEPLAGQVRRATSLRHEAEAAQQDASAAMIEAAQALAESGLRVRDIGGLLGVSFQRAAQLAAARADPRPARDLNSRL